MILVVGATGATGSQICGLLAAKGESVRAMVRPTADPAKVEALRALGVEIVKGDLRDRDSLDAACCGVSAVITTVSAMPFTYVPGSNDLSTTDLAGTMALVEAAKESGVGHFVYTSFSGGIEVDCPLTRVKRTVEGKVAGSGMRYTILRPSYFMEVWLSPVAGFDFPNAKAAVYGEGDNPISWISEADVAAFAVRSLEAPVAWNKVIELGGPEPLAPLQVVKLFEQVAERPFDVQFVAEAALKAQQEASADPFAQSFAALQRSYAGGDPIEMGKTTEAMGVRLTSVTEYAERALGRVPASVG